MSFAAEFDLQPFHPDERTASASIFGGLAGNRWRTAAITMRLLVEGDLEPAGGIVGAGFDEFRWHGRFGQAMSGVLGSPYSTCLTRMASYARFRREVHRAPRAVQRFWYGWKM